MRNAHTHQNFELVAGLVRTQVEVGYDLLRFSTHLIPVSQHLHGIVNSTRILTSSSADTQGYKVVPPEEGSQTQANGHVVAHRIPSRSLMFVGDHNG